MYKYNENDVFNKHTDGMWPGFTLNESRTGIEEFDESIWSCLTMLLYLNDPTDGVVGGNTRLFHSDDTFIDVTPMKGSALFFRHGYGVDSVVHEGCRVTGTVPKYVARINIMYES